MSNFMDFELNNNQNQVQRPQMNFSFSVPKPIGLMMPQLQFQEGNILNIPNLNQIQTQQILQVNQEEDSRTMQVKNIYPNRYLILNLSTKTQQISLVQYGYCLVMQKLKKKIENMYLNAENIYLIFKIKEDKQWIGCAKMISRLDDMEFFPSNVYDNLSDADQYFDAKNFSFFKIDWIARNHLFFENSDNIINQYNLKYPVYKCKDGQEIEEKAANQLMELLKYPPQQNQQSWRPNLDIDDPQSSLSSDESSNEDKNQSNQQNFMVPPPLPIMSQSAMMIPQQLMNNNLLNMTQSIPTPLANMTMPINYEIPKNFFYLPFIIQEERESIFKKGAGPLGDFLIKSLKQQDRSESSSESDRSRHKRKTVYKPNQDRRARDSSHKRRNSREKKRKVKRGRDYSRSRSRERGYRKRSISNSRNSRDRRRNQRMRKSSSSTEKRRKDRRSRRSQSPKRLSQKRHKKRDKYYDRNSSSNSYRNKSLSSNNEENNMLDLQQIINDSPIYDEKGKQTIKQKKVVKRDR